MPIVGISDYCGDSELSGRLHRGNFLMTGCYCKSAWKFRLAVMASRGRVVKKYGG